MYGNNSTPKTSMQLIAENSQQLRKQLKMSREELAERSGVSYSSIRKFESTGKISLESLLKLAQVLNRLEDFENLLRPSDLEDKRTLFDV